eukprot:5102042-Prymnesium_polylepis.1
MPTTASVQSQAPRGFIGELPKVFKLVSVLTRVRLLCDPMASVPFEQLGTSMELITEETLEARRAIAANLTEETIRALRAKPDPRKP